MKNIFMQCFVIEFNKYYYEFNKYYYKLNKNKIPVHIVGNGWGAYHFTKNLDKNKYKPIIIAPNKKVLDTTKLINKLININEDIEFDNPYANIIIDYVEDINFTQKQIKTKNKFYKYEYVVLTIGSEPNDFNNISIRDYTYKFKSINDIIKLHNNLNNNFTVYIIGGGVTGIELAIKLTSLGYKIKILEGLNNILTGFNENTQKIILEELKKNKFIEIYFNTQVQNINNNIINAYETNEKKDINFDYKHQKDIIIWTAGVRINGYKKTPLYKSLEQITDIKQRGIVVNDNFTIKNFNNLFCIGDIVANKGPPTAQNAKKQAEWLAQYFNNNFNDDINKFQSNITTKIIHMDKKIYLESLYSCFLPNWINNIIEKLFK